MAGDTANADEYNGGDLLITLIIFQVLTWISVALRAYVRTCLTKNFQTDDWLMLVAQVCSSHKHTGELDIHRSPLTGLR